MKQLQFVKKGFKPVSRTVKWLKRFSPKHRYHQMPADSSFSNQLSDTGMNINIMSFNIRRGTKQDGKNHWIFRRDLVNEILHRYSSDVLGLQEALDFQISEIRAMLPGYEMINIISSGDNKVLHNAIFYKAARFLVSEEGTFWYSETPDNLKGQTLINTKAEGKVQNPNPLMDTFRVRTPFSLRPPALQRGQSFQPPQSPVPAKPSKTAAPDS
jgi:hypothetical protein